MSIIKDELTYYYYQNSCSIIRSAVLLGVKFATRRIDSEELEYRLESLLQKLKKNYAKHAKQKIDFAD